MLSTISLCVISLLCPVQLLYFAPGTYLVLIP